jgi:hypothetical protein
MTTGKPHPVDAKTATVAWEKVARILPMLGPGQQLRVVFERRRGDERLVARVEAAEAERDSLKRQLAQAVKAR